MTLQFNKNDDEYQNDDVFMKKMHFPLFRHKIIIRNLPYSENVLQILGKTAKETHLKEIKHIIRDIITIIQKSIAIIIQLFIENIPFSYIRTMLLL